MRTPHIMLGFVLGAYAAQGAYWTLPLLVMVCAVDVVRWAIA